MELSRTTLIFLVLIALVFIGSIVVTESFVDASGTMVTVSLKDLLQVFGITKTTSTDSSGSTVKSKTSYDSLRDDLEKKQKESLLNDAQAASTTTATTSTKTTTTGSNLDDAFKSELLKEVRESVRDELQKQQEGSVLSDNCIDSVANQQGTDWMRYIPGKNPSDYIRKDSIPCYSCNLA